jgi:hypothetical protein
VPWIGINLMVQVDSSRNLLHLLGTLKQFVLVSRIFLETCPVNQQKIEKNEIILRDFKMYLSKVTLL